MDLKKIGKALLFPHIAIMIILIPIVTVLLVGSMYGTVVRHGGVSRGYATCIMGHIIMVGLLV